MAAFTSGHGAWETGPVVARLEQRYQGRAASIPVAMWLASVCGLWWGNQCEKAWLGYGGIWLRGPSCSQLF